MTRQEACVALAVCCEKKFDLSPNWKGDAEHIRNLVCGGVFYSLDQTGEVRFMVPFGRDCEELCMSAQCSMSAAGIYTQVGGGGGAIWVLAWSKYLPEPIGIDKDEECSALMELLTA